MDNKGEILEKLGSENQELVQEALGEIKTAGDITLVPDLFNALKIASDHHIVHQITSMLADIRDSAFQEKIVEAIQETSDSAFRAKLLRVCWESSFDYSQYALLFAKIFVEEKLDVAFEALTILEELSNYTDEQKVAIEQLFRNSELDEKKSILADCLLNDIK